MKPLAPNVLIQQRYLIVHLIGRGGMGEVYLAVDQRLGSAVALKRTFFSDDEMLANAFEREARTLANLRHPVLPKVSDHFLDGENQFLVMEHITGDDLSKRLEKTLQPFPLSWVLFWADQLLDALHYLHSNTPPIIHRDIKPQNLKLTNDNHIILLDFGLSKNSVGETKHTSTGSVVGYTPHYAPMEQIRGTGTNAQSDLYSLSATLYQLLSNTVPPDALTRADSLLSGLPDPIKPLNELSEEVSEEVSDVILRGMEVSQDKRYSSAREMQKALRDAYAKLQQVMSAQTVAFNVGEDAESLSKTPIEAPTSDEPVIAAGDSTGGFPSGTAEDSAPVLVSGPDKLPDPEATLQISQQEAEALNIPPVDQDVSALVDESEQNVGFGQGDEPKPSDIKTEVLLAGESPAIRAAQEGRSIPAEDEPAEPVSFDTGEDFHTSDDLGGGGDFSTADDLSTPDEGFVPGAGDFSTQGDFSTGEDLASGESFSPDATKQMINFDSGAGKEDAFADQDDTFEEDFSDAGVSGEESGDSFSTSSGVAGGTVPTFKADAEYPREGQTNPAAFAKPEAVQPKVSAKKKSGGKTFAIIAGIAALFILLIGSVGGVAWYLVNQRSVGGDENTPTPEETVEAATPSPVETPFQIGTNTGDENVLTTNGNANTEPGGTSQQQSNTRPTPKPATTPSRPPATRVPVRTPKPPPTRPPTPKPTKTNRTGIIH